MHWKLIQHSVLLSTFYKNYCNNQATIAIGFDTFEGMMSRLTVGERVTFGLDTTNGPYTIVC